MLKRWLLYVGSVFARPRAWSAACWAAFVLALLYPTLPSLETLTDYQPKIPLRVVSAPRATCSASSARSAAPSSRSPRSRR